MIHATVPAACPFFRRLQALRLQKGLVPYIVKTRTVTVGPTSRETVEREGREIGTMLGEFVATLLACISVLRESRRSVNSGVGKSCKRVSLVRVYLLLGLDRNDRGGQGV